MTAEPSRIIRDREGGFIALDRIERGRLVVLAPISPPLRVRRDRQLRRRGLTVTLVINLWALAIELALMVLARACG